MAEGSWRHTAELLAQQINLNRAKDARAIGADVCNPYRQQTCERRREKAFMVSGNDWVANLAKGFNAAQGPPLKLSECVVGWSNQEREEVNHGC